MPVNTLSRPLWIILILLVCAGAMATACNTAETQKTPPPGIRTWLLVKAPENPLPLNKSVNVRSRTEDGEARVSHVELYALEVPSGETNLLIRSDPAPFDQTSFTVDQIFTPTQPGHYVIQVIGYNRRGEKSESNIISFDVK
ncbi:MAG: hypothetical protein JXM69_03960 [Anaerolineae bacterium]|nr:hypothetical protein [Anaerolineae bacterium]